MKKQFLLFVLFFTAANCAQGADLTRHTFVEPHMGTRFQITVYASSAKTAGQAAKAAFARIAELNRIMSDYDRASELMRLCLKAGGPAVKVSPELFYILEKSQQLSRKTGGAFDVTIGPVSRLWRQARKRLEMPEKEDLAKVRKLVGYQQIRLNAKERTVKLLQSGMRLDLGGIAKGYAADDAIKVLGKHGITRALVAAGGDIVVSDPPPKAEGWKVGIAPLSNPGGKPERTLLLKQAAVSTSGDAEQFVVIQGKRYSHIADPRTGIGVPGRFSVTVVARRGVDSDSLATAVSVLGDEKGMELIRNSGAEVLIIRKIGEKKKALQSNGFKKHLVK